MPPRHSLWLLLFASSALFAQQSGLVDPGIIYQRAEQRQQQINRNAARQDFSTLDFSAPASEDQVAAPGDRHACTSYQHIVLDAPSPFLFSIILSNRLDTRRYALRANRPITRRVNAFVPEKSLILSKPHKTG